MKRKRLLTFLAAAAVLAFSFLLSLWIDGQIEQRKYPPPPTTAETPMSYAETTLSPWQEWPLILVNRTHAVPDDYVPPLFTLENGQQYDARIYPMWQRMVRAAKKNGFLMEAAYCYRSNETQRQIMDERVAWYRRQGNSQQEAERKAKEYVAEPGHSEHELGLAIDIHAGKNTNAEQLFKWLQANAWRYGFIERYPKDKVEITGIAYERWHYRFVGRDAAKEMKKKHLTLEEYLGQVN